MKLKQVLLVVLSVIVVGLTFTTVNADMGPKPTSYFEIKGIDEPFKFDLLVYYDEDVPVLTDDEMADQLDFEYYTDVEEYPDILNGYQDEDGYASYSLYWNIPHVLRYFEDSDQYFAGYFASPSIFKIAIVTESNNILVSDIITKTLYSASFVYDFSDDSVIETEASTTGVVYPDVGAVTETIPYFTMTLLAIIGVIITLVIELGLLYLFKYRERNTYYLVLLANIITQLTLYGFTLITYYFWSGPLGAIIIFFLGELIVLTIEIILYLIFMKEKQFVRPVFYAVIANILSGGIGLIILNTPFI